MQVRTFGSTSEEWSDGEEKDVERNDRSSSPHFDRERPTHCFNCGNEGHIAKDCPEERVQREETRSCHRCGKEGHIARDCPERDDTRVCHRCGQPGHIVRDCPEADDRPSQGGYERRQPRYGREDHGNFQNRNSNYGGDREYEPRERRGPVTCYNCGEEGHVSRDCPEPKKQRDMSMATCYNCQQTGHMANECPNERVERPRQQQSRNRYESKPRYGNDQDNRRNYDRPDRRGNDGGYQSRQPRGPITCYNCGGEGHMSRDCPEPRKPREYSDRREGRSSRRADSDDEN